MALKISIGGEYLDLPCDYSLDWDILSPIFNEHGSQTSPITLPATPHNRRLLAHPARIDAAIRQAVRDGVFADGVFLRNCKINLVGADDKGIDISMGTDESLMYAEWADRKLREISGLPTYTPSGTDPLGTLIELMNVCYHREAELDYHVFPVAVEFDQPSDAASADDIPVCTILNEVYRDDDERKTGDLIGTVLYSAEHTVTVGDSADGNTVRVPRGYGITPFLKVGRFLHILFDSYGYTLEENVFDTDPQLKHLVILNNTADAIVTGTLSYADLLPDCTVNEFLDSLRAHFGTVFYLDGSSLTARCVLIRDTLSAVPDADITLMHASRPRLTMNAPRQLVLSSKSNYSYGESREDTYEKLLSKYGALTDTNAGGRLVHGMPKYVQDLFTGTIFQNGESPMQRRFFSSMQHGWHRHTDGMAEENVEGTDTLVPMYAYSGMATVGSLPPFNLFALPLYLCGVRNAHTALKASADDDTTLSRTTDLAFCFAHGDYVTAGDAQPYGLFYGSPLCYAPDGSHYEDAQGNAYHSSLIYVGESGAYAQYWKEYDRMLRFSNVTVETDMSLGASLPDLSRKKLLFGQEVLIDALTQSFPLSRHVARTVTMRTVKPLLPSADADTEELTVDVPDLSPSPGYWNIASDESDVKNDLVDEIQRSLKAEYGENNFEIEKLTWHEYEKNIPNDLSLPTAAQIASHAILSYTYGLRLTAYYKYKKTGWLHWESGTGTRSSGQTAVTVTRTAVAYSS